MIVDQDQSKCAHEGCKCQVPSGQAYCSPHCAEAAASVEVRGEESCQCGHGACKTPIS
jgi:hypothetical protein